jgi:sulfur-carrier protein
MPPSSGDKGQVGASGSPIDPDLSLIVRYFAGARAAAGCAEEVLAAGYSLAGLVEELAGRHGAGLAKVLGAASFLVDGVAWHDRVTPVPAGATVDVLPPFAGG